MDETFPYKKKKPQNSKSSRHSDHKHRYEKIIVKSFLGWHWGERCTVCGRVKEKSLFVKEFIKPEYRNYPYYSPDYCFSVEEMKEKYEGIPICDEKGRKI